MINTRGEVRSGEKTEAQNPPNEDHIAQKERAWEERDTWPTDRFLLYFIKTYDDLGENNQASKVKIEHW